MDSDEAKLKKKQLVKEKLRLKKKLAKKNKRRARIVIRNLPFTATEENVRVHFEKFGEVDDVKVLKKEDGKLVGCGFVQFKLVQKAAKAIHHLNGKPFLDRNITCEWALPKNKFTEKQAAKIKEEPLDTEVTVKEEPIDDSVQNITIKQDEESEELTEKLAAKDSDSEENSDIEDQSKEFDISSDDAGTDDEKESIVEEEHQQFQRPPRVLSNDISEGKTVFIKNVPYSATNEDIHDCLSQFGQLYYARICMDRFTEHSKGSAFVKFLLKEDADRCLETTGVMLMDNILEFHPAMSREDVTKKSKEQKTKQPRDSRNLYLVKEGVIIAGTKAAEGVSAGDMDKRLQLENYKTQMLRNLNMFISRARLVIHNIPPSWDDNKLRSLCLKHAGPTAIIRYVKVMRDLRNIDGTGLGRSKEFGYVMFQDHEHALKTLRSLNNNPNVFSSIRRPIVSFSIENKVKIAAREKRLVHSKLKNPNFKNYDPELVKSHKQQQKERNFNKKRKLEAESTEEANQFSGIEATPGVKKFRNKFTLKNQAIMHHEHLKNIKNRKKSMKKTLQEKKKEFTKQPRQKIVKKVKDDNFSKLVNEYKKKLNVPRHPQKSKWYEDGK